MRLLKLFKDFLLCLRSRGLTSTMKILLSSWMDRRTDGSLGIDTKDGIDIRSSADKSLENLNHSSLYEATRATPFLEVIRLAKIDTRLTFIDVGCGKGRVLALAALAGFEKIKGIEFVKELSDIALKNIHNIKEKFPTSQISVINCDILDYEICSDDSIFYLYDPFSEIILDKFLARVTHSYNLHKRAIHIIYYNNLYTYEDTFKKYLSDKAVREAYQIDGNRIIIYKLAT